MSGMHIGQKLNKLNKESLIFRYELDSYSDLVLHNNFLLSKVSQYHANSNLPIKLKHLTEFELDNTKTAIKKGITQLKEDDVEYDINELGYRSSNPIQSMKNAIGIFGCSFTFGVGVPHKDIFTTLLEEKLNEPVYNFGIPGGSIQKQTKSFTSVNSIFKLKKAVFVLPSFYRYEFISAPNGHIIEQVDFIPNFAPKGKMSEKNYQSFYDMFDDITFLNEYVKHLNMIKMSAKLHGTEIYFTTWCKDTNDLIKKYNIENFGTQILFIESYEELQGMKVIDYARDGMHPGVRTHIETANQIETMLTSKIVKNLI